MSKNQNSFIGLVCFTINIYWKELVQTVKNKQMFTILSYTSLQQRRWKIDLENNKYSEFESKL